MFVSPASYRLSIYVSLIRGKYCPFASSPVRREYCSCPTNPTGHRSQGPPPARFRAGVMGHTGFRRSKPYRASGHTQKSPRPPVFAEVFSG